MVHKLGYKNIYKFFYIQLHNSNRIYNEKE